MENSYGIQIMKGEPNRVYVFTPSGNQNFDAIVESYKAKKDSYGLYLKMLQLSNKWDIIAEPDFNNLFVSPPREFGSTFLMILTIMAEGAASGGSRANYYNKDPGIYGHYESLNSLNIARNYWLPSFSIHTFQKWW